jgi:hypothetical protein
MESCLKVASAGLAARSLRGHQEGTVSRRLRSSSDARGRKRDTPTAPSKSASTNGRPVRRSGGVAAAFMTAVFHRCRALISAHIITRRQSPQARLFALAGGRIGGTHEALADPDLFGPILQGESWYGSCTVRSTNKRGSGSHSRPAAACGLPQATRRRRSPCSRSACAGRYRTAR